MKKEDNTKKKNKNIVSTVIIIISIIVIIVAGANLIRIFLDYKGSDTEYEAILQGMTTTASTGENGGAAGGDGGSVGSGSDNRDPNEIYPDDFRPDFEQLKAQNQDVVAWIRFPNLDVSYPVLQGQDNDYYLHHTFYGESRTAASIFMDYQNVPNFTDDNTVIYGHNMRNGSMFAQMNKFTSQDFYLENSYFWIYTPSTIYRCDIFSTHELDSSQEGIPLQCETEADFAAYVERLINIADYDTGVEMTTKDRMVTLTTCTPRSGVYRYLVHAKLAAAFDFNSGALTNLPAQQRGWVTAEEITEETTEQATQE